jgi:8-oxo-dGTP diphosphatase
VSRGPWLRDLLCAIGRAEPASLFSCTEFRSRLQLLAEQLRMRDVAHRLRLTLRGRRRKLPLVGEMRALADIDWTRWRGVACTLVFVIRGGEVLLIRKQRGLGAGKINAPGGKTDPGESPLAGAIRETREEVCATPRELAWAGRNRFQFTDGSAIDVQVFRASALDGTPAATAEADPFWSPVERIPYGEMWEDDALWLPHLFAGREFSGRFLFDGDRMLDWAIELAH